MSKKNLYKIIFQNQSKIYEIHAKGIHHGSLLGFIEVEELVFGERSGLLVDPAEENLRTEFSGVARTYLPLHCIIRIDEVEKKGLAKISDATKTGKNIATFPIYTHSNEVDKS